MKKIVFATAAIAGVVGTFDAFAQTVVCSGATTAASGAAVTTGGFVATSFTPKCSANVHLVGIDNTSSYAVGAASTKGKTKFGGSTAGGGVSGMGTCAAATCAATDASAAASAAPSS